MKDGHVAIYLSMFHHQIFVNQLTYIQYNLYLFRKSKLSVKQSTIYQLNLFTTKRLST